MQGVRDPTLQPWVEATYGVRQITQPEVPELRAYTFSDDDPTLYMEVLENCIIVFCLLFPTRGRVSVWPSHRLTLPKFVSSGCLISNLIIVWCKRKPVTATAKGPPQKRVIHPIY